MIKTFISRSTSSQHILKQVTQEVTYDSSLLLFFSSTKQNFEELSSLLHETHPRLTIAGCTTTGEISNEGFSEGTVSFMLFSKKFTAETVLLQDIHKYPYSQIDDIKQAVSLSGISTREGNDRELGIVLPTGLHGGEEKMMSTIQSVFSYDFPLIGGTAGDDAKFQTTKVSLNGQVSTTGGVLILLKSPVPVRCYKENIFQATDNILVVTEADSANRVVSKFNGRKASQEYARLLGISETTLSTYFASNPLGRQRGYDHYIASPFQVLPNGSIQFYCQVFEGDQLSIMTPINPEDKLKETVRTIHLEFSRVEGVFATNCILRKAQFQQNNLERKLSTTLKDLAPLAGFSSYGEQLNRSLLNQTLVVAVFGERRTPFFGN